MGAGLTTLDCAAQTTREINTWLKEHAKASACEVNAGREPLHVALLHPDSRHNLAVGLLSPLRITLAGPVGYYCGGLCDGIDLEIHGGCGWGLAENLMGGRVVLHGSAGSSAGATLRGGHVIIHGDAGARCGAAMKGGVLIVEGDVGIMTGFMMQKGRIIIGGNAGEALGDSLYEGVIYVRGEVESLGADAKFSPLNPADCDFLATALADALLDFAPAGFKKIESARRLYNFDTREKEFWKDAL